MIDTSALREKVLDLAIRGKLVPQDPTDEPASVLLERIRAEKEQMVKDGKLKAKDIKNDTVIFKGEDNLHYEKFSDGTVKCIEDEIPFDVPDGWAWCRLEVFCPYGDCEKVDTKNIEDDEWILDLEDIEKETGKIINYVSKAERNSVSTKHKFYQGQLLYSKLRPYLNKVVIAHQNGYCTSEILPLTFYGNISSRYMQLFLMSNTFLSYVNMISYGVKMPRLGTEDGKRALIALPPIKEQERITNKYDSLKPTIANLQTNCNDIQATIAAIKSKILDLAIRGKLVPQNQDDEPASVLLERIKVQKEELIKQGKIKRDKKESVIFKGDDNSYYRSNTDGESFIEDFPFELPNGWEWCNLSMIGYTNIGLTYKPTDIVPDGTIVLRSSNIVNGKIDLTDLVRVNTNIRDNQYIEENDILICARNGSKALVGKCAIFEGISERTSFGAFMAVYRSEFYKYIYYFLNSQIFRDTFMNDDTKQINQLTQDMIKNTVLALPPLKEQKRIVDAIETAFEQLDNILNSI